MESACRRWCALLTQCRVITPVEYKVGQTWRAAQSILDPIKWLHRGPNAPSCWAAAAQTAALRCRHCLAVFLNWFKGCFTHRCRSLSSSAWFLSEFKSKVWVLSEGVISVTFLFTRDQLKNTKQKHYDINMISTMALIHKADRCEVCQCEPDCCDHPSTFLQWTQTTASEAISLWLSPASVYLSPTFSSSSLVLGGGHTACRRPGVRSSLSAGDVTSVCGERKTQVKNVSFIHVHTAHLLLTTNTFSSK